MTLNWYSSAPWGTVREDKINYFFYIASILYWQQNLFFNLTHYVCRLIHNDVRTTICFNATVHVEFKIRTLAVRSSLEWRKPGNAFALVVLNFNSHPYYHVSASCTSWQEDVLFTEEGREPSKRLQIFENMRQASLGKLPVSYVTTCIGSAIFALMRFYSNRKLR